MRENREEIIMIEEHRQMALKMIKMGRMKKSIWAQFAIAVLFEILNLIKKCIL